MESSIPDLRPADGPAPIARRSLHDQMVERFETRDRLEYFKLNQGLHASFLRLSVNAALAASHAAIQSRPKRIR